MPPPASKPTDPTDLADALTSAGIDLKEEEARLTASTSSANPLASSSDEEAARIYHRRQAEMRAAHLTDPFLQPEILSNRLFRKTRDSACQLFTLNAGNGTIVTHGQQADIATLLSLGCKERLNQFITRAVVLARARRRAQNVVSGEWADSVKGASVDPKAIPDSAISPGNPLKRSFSFATEAPIPTTTLTNETAKALRGLQQREFQKEQERLVKKSKRDAPTSSSTPTVEPTTPAATSIDPPSTPTMSLKESRKHIASKKEEVMSHKAANATANMMMGIGGFGGKRKKKTYSWMSTAGGGVGGAGQAVLAPAGIATPTTPGATGGMDYWSGGSRLGSWRDDGERGGGVQIRDWIGALEGDGRGVGKGIVKAYLRMK